MIGEGEGRERQTSGEEGTPPPAIVLSTEVEVAEENRGLGTDHQQHHKRQQDEPKHVVHLSTPTLCGGQSSERERGREKGKSEGGKEEKKREGER